MSINLVVNGISYTFPTVNDVNWGQQVTSWATAITNGTLQKTGGTFQLLGEVDFGTSHGLKSLYYKSRAAIPASAGEVRLGNTEQILWRNAGDTADLGISVSGADTLVSTAPLSVPALTTAGTITTPLSTGLVKSASGVLGSSLLVDADVDVSAGIARTKLASGTANHVVINDGSGVLSSEAALATTRGGTGQTSVTTGDILYGSSSNVISKLPIGSAAQVLTVTGGVPTWENVPSGFADPTTTAGDIIFKNASAVTARLPVGTANTVLTSNGTVPTYSQVTSAMIADGTIVNADINASAAIDGSKIVAASAIVSGVVTTGTQTLAGAKTFSGALAATAGTGSISPTSGALVVTGGVGVSQNLVTGGIIVSESTNAATSASTGAIRSLGGIGAVGNIVSGAALQTTAGAVEVGTGRGSDGLAYIDFTTQVGADWNTRIIRDTGVNGTFVTTHNGTGEYRINTANSANIELQRGGTNHIVIDSGGTMIRGRTAAVSAGFVGHELFSAYPSSVGVGDTFGSYETGGGITELNISSAGYWIISWRLAVTRNTAPNIITGLAGGLVLNGAVASMGPIKSGSYIWNRVGHSGGAAGINGDISGSVVCLITTPGNVQLQGFITCTGGSTILGNGSPDGTYIQAVRIA